MSNIDEIDAALRVIAAAWPARIEPDQLTVWWAAIAERCNDVPPGAVSDAAKTLVVAGGPFPPSLGEFLAEMLGVNDIEPAASAWLTAYRPTNPIAAAATAAVGGQWQIANSTMIEATRRAWVETYDAETARWRRAVLTGKVPAPRALTERGELIELPPHPPAIVDSHPPRPYWEIEAEQDEALRREIEECTARWATKTDGQEQGE
jgi:hypothetical protein